MKKIIGILSVVLIAFTMIINLNFSSSSETDVDLASLLVKNIANADPEIGTEPPNHCFYTGYWLDECWTPVGTKYHCEPTLMNLSC